MVDPATVTETKKVDVSAVSVPKTTTDLHAGTYKYQGKIVMMGREINISLSTRVADDNGTWMALDEMSSPMGSGSDTATLEKGTLVLRKRSVRSRAGSYRS